MGEFRMWINYQNGSTIGESGTENGNIIFDEEHVDGARITLEQNCHQNIPFAITSGIYGGIVHTTFASDKSNFEFFNSHSSKYANLYGKFLSIMS